MNKHLGTALRTDARMRVARCAKGWTPERRARYAALARLSQPWRHSTGPRTAAGKARVAMNALRNGYRSKAWRLKAQRIRQAIRLCAHTLLLVRVLRQQQDRVASPVSRGNRLGRDHASRCDISPAFGR